MLSRREKEKIGCDGQFCVSAWLGHRVPRHMVIVLGASMSTFRMKVTFESVKHHKAWLLPSQLKTRMEQKGWVKGTPPAWLLWTRTLVVSCLWIPMETLTFFGSWAFWLSHKNFPYLLSLFSGLWTQTRTVPSAFLSLQLASCRPWDFLASTVT